MLDINLFRPEKGGNPELVKESQRRRYAKVELVDEVMRLDQEWRSRRFELDKLNAQLNKASKEVGMKKKNKEDATEEMAKVAQVKQSIEAAKVAENDAREAVEKAVHPIGNLVHDSVPINDDEEHNQIVKTYGECATEGQFYNHVDLMAFTGISDVEKGADVAGNRGYYLKGAGVLLNQALINYALAFLVKRGYCPLQTPFFMRKDIMGECAQLDQFDEELYKVSGEGDDKYLIATSEQPICAMHRKEWMATDALPRKFAGYSTCFRKEAGSHGRDTAGIFRVHQFEKVEQFCVTSPHDDESWAMLEDMITIAEDFYKSLKLPYRVVNIVSGELNNAAAKKYDLEAWFPAAKTFRELVSCSNCTDYQSRRLEVRYGQKKMNDPVKQYVHMLNATLVATERAMCCIVENYQTADGIVIPDVLKPYMCGIEFIPFVNKPSSSKTKEKKEAPASAAKDPAPSAAPKPVQKSSKPADKPMPAAESKAPQPQKKKKETAAAEPAPPSVINGRICVSTSDGVDAKVLSMLLQELNTTIEIVATSDCQHPTLSLEGEGEIARTLSGVLRALSRQQKSHLFPMDAIEAYARTEEALEWFVSTIKNNTTSISDPSTFQVIESWLAGHSGKFLTGKGLTVADLAIAGYIAAHQQPSVLGTRGKKWFEEISKRPSYKKVFAA